MNRILWYEHEIDEWTSNYNATTQHFVIPIMDYRAQHIIHILKSKEHEALKSGIVNKSIGHMTLIHFRSDGIECMYECEPIDEARGERVAKPHTIHIHALLAHTRPSVMERSIKDLVSMGVASIDIYTSDLTEKNYIQSRMWRTIDHTKMLGAMQGGGYTIPPLCVHHSLEEGITALATRHASHPLLSVVCEVQQSLTFSGMSELLSHRKEEMHVITAIGPERGHTGTELAAFHHHGYQGFSLGTSILRSEVATTLSIGFIQTL